MKYSKLKAKQRRQALYNVGNQLKQTEVDLNPTAENVALLEICKTNYEKAYEYITKGSILRSQVRLYEEGEKNTQYFLNLENHKNMKSCVRNIYNKESKLTSNPREIMKELEDFYKDLYQEKTKQSSNENINTNTK